LSNGQSWPKGFTLIELAIVIAIIVIISSAGLFSFSSFNRSQLFDTGVSEVTSLLATARSNAFSQVVPSACGSTAISSYKVATTISGQSYGLYAVCGGDQLISAKRLPGQMIFDLASIESISFEIATGVVNTPGSIILTGYGKSQTIFINKFGSVCSTSC